MAVSDAVDGDDGMLTCWQGRQTCAILHIERLEGRQLSEPFGQCNKLRETQVELGGISQMRMVNNALGQSLHMLDRGHEAPLREVPQLPKSFGE